MSDLVIAAIAYAAEGWAVFPCAQNKAPFTEHGFHDASTEARASAASAARSSGATRAPARTAAGAPTVAEPPATMTVSLMFTTPIDDEGGVRWGR